MPRTGTEHAVGPYKHGKRYRIVFKSGVEGISETESFATEEEAIAARDEHNAQAGSRTLNEAVEEYVSTVTQGSQPTVRFRLRGFFRLDEGDRPMNAITEQEARKLFKKRRTEVSATTLRGELRYARQFFAKQIVLGRLKESPVARVAIDDSEPCYCGAGKRYDECHGIKSKGKPQLRVRESKQFLAHIMKDQSPEATAVLTALTLKLRASAVVDRKVKDLDDEGWVLWYWQLKKKGRGKNVEIELPAFLRERLLKLAAGKGPEEPLFVTSDGSPADRHWLLRNTVRLCKAAGVSRVTPHGLRGMGASQMVREGDPLIKAAAALDHEDAYKGAITLQEHYLAAGAIESGHAKAIERLVTTANARKEEVDADIN